MNVARRLRRLPRYARTLIGTLQPSAVQFLRRWPLISASVRGWLRLPDAWLLYQLARDGAGEGRIVEIGSAWGRSTVCLALGTQRAGREHVIAIDPHTGDDWYLADERLERLDSLAEFTRNLRRLGVTDWVEAIVMTSHAAVDQVSGPIRLLFIDGLHTYEGVSRDIHDWVPKVVPGGSVVFDDYDNQDAGVGVRAAVDELLASGLVSPVLRRRFNLVWTFRL